MTRNLRIGGTITALATPFNETSIDRAALRALVEWQIQNGVDGLAVCCVTGEGPVLSAEERAAVIETSIATAGGRVPVIAATGTNSTDSTIALTVMAESLGARAALVTLPYYSKPGQKGILQHFERLAAETRLPVLIENAPGRTASDLSVETLARLADIASIVAIVDASGEISRCAGMPAALRERFRFLSGHDATALAFACCGGDGCISAGANALPRLFSSMQQAARGGNLSAALSLQDRVWPLVATLGSEGDPALVKYALSRLHGFSPAVRLPLVEPDAESRTAIDGALLPFLCKMIPKTALSL